MCKLEENSYFTRRQRVDDEGTMLSLSGLTLNSPDSDKEKSVNTFK
jgi:hypothetical protein